MKFFFSRILAPLYSKLLGIVAYGPWGRSFHQLLIKGFKSLYKIKYEETTRFHRLGDFFLRDTVIEVASSPLVSPSESCVLEGFRPVEDSPSVEVKGLRYQWSEMPELQNERWWQKGHFINLYLAPDFYHWVHAPADGEKLIAYRYKGLAWPVNAFGRRVEPALYTKNERLTFRYCSKEFGEVAVMAVGAMGVSCILSAVGDVPYGRWTSLKDQVQKAERLCGFRLGSTVLLLVERPGPLELPFLKENSMLKVGNAFDSVH